MLDFSKRPGNTRIRQQKLKAWQPIMSPVPVITCFSIMGIIFLAIGGLLYHFNNSINEYEFDYSSDEACVSSSLCEINITINSDTPLRAPVYMYYKLTNYYQNHRRYVTSRSDSQLSGDYVNSYSSIQDCKPYESLENSREEEDMYLPCGLIASSQFSGKRVSIIKSLMLMMY
eukprot:TRINITY_DN427_c0_g1_i3.p1 TRINITY_DN427_c0_g1~~TRINITY_DN427_c0_g1_i3.p1  ORF type:complete len:173 (+),score=13.84 TRINITY_DN427_c0_g1_i3:60-578(+)